MSEITCARCEKTVPAMSSPPMGGSLGETLMQRTCPACYEEWLSQQILYINHYNLQMADPDDRKKLIQVMKEFLKLVPTE